MIDAIAKAAKSGTNEAVGHWVDRLGLSGMLSTIAMKAGEVFNVIADLNTILDWASVVALIAMLPLIANRIMLFRIQRVERKIKELELKKLKDED